MNLYAYALNDPLNLVDPYGLQGAPFNQLPQINVTAYYMASGWAGSINYAAFNSALHTALAIGVPGYAATGSAILSYQQGNYWNAAGYSTIAAAELGLTVVTAGQYAVAAAAARGSIRAGAALGAARTVGFSDSIAGTARVCVRSSCTPIKLNHIFGQSKHQLDGLLSRFGTQKSAFNAVEAAANAELAAGRLVIGPNGILPSAGNVLNVDGILIQLSGGRVINGRVSIGSFSGVIRQP